MIVIGFPGIGKTTLAGDGFIDLESSNFVRSDGKRDEEWYITYGRIAEDLSRQGYTVFVSSHELVQHFFKTSNEEVVAVFPTADLWKEWANKLAERYFTDPSEKNKRAAVFMYQHGRTALKELREAGFRNIELGSMDYWLEGYLRYLDTDVEAILTKHTKTKEVRNIKFKIVNEKDFLREITWEDDNGQPHKFRLYDWEDINQWW